MTKIQQSKLSNNTNLLNKNNNNNLTKYNNNDSINSTFNSNKNDILSKILKDKLDDDKKINTVLDIVKEFKLLSTIEDNIEISKKGKEFTILLNKIKNKEQIETNILEIDKKLNVRTSKNLEFPEYINNYDYTIAKYYINKNIVIKELQNKNLLLNIIDYFTNLVNFKTNNNNNNILLIERQILLFLLVYLTGVDLNLLLELRKTDIDEFFDSYKNSLGGLFFISNRKLNNTTKQFEVTDKSKFHLIKIKNYLSDYLIQTKNTNNLIDIIYNKFVKETDLYKRKANTDYMFSLLSNNNKPITKSNAIKDLNDILDNLKNYKTIDGNSIIKSELVLDDLFITTNFDNQDLNHFNTFTQLYKLIYTIYELIINIRNYINEEYKIKEDNDI